MLLRFAPLLLVVLLLALLGCSDERTQSGSENSENAQAEQFSFDAHLKRFPEMNDKRAFIDFSRFYSEDNRRVPPNEFVTSPGFMHPLIPHREARHFYGTDIAGDQTQIETYALGRLPQSPGDDEDYVLIMHHVPKDAVNEYAVYIVGFSKSGERVITKKLFRTHWGDTSPAILQYHTLRLGHAQNSIFDIKPGWLDWEQYTGQSLATHLGESDQPRMTTVHHFQYGTTAGEERWHLLNKAVEDVNDAIFFGTANACWEPESPEIYRLKNLKVDKLSEKDFSYSEASLDGKELPLSFLAQRDVAKLMGSNYRQKLGAVWPFFRLNVSEAHALLALLEFDQKKKTWSLLLGSFDAEHYRRAEKRISLFTVNQPGGFTALKISEDGLLELYPDTKSKRRDGVKTTRIIVTETGELNVNDTEPTNEQDAKLQF